MADAQNKSLGKKESSAPNADLGLAKRRKKNVTTRGWLEKYSKQIEQLDNITEERKEKIADAGLSDITKDIL